MPKFKPYSLKGTHKEKMTEDEKRQGREPVAWITRGGKHIPIFDGDEVPYKFYGKGDEAAGSVDINDNASLYFRDGVIKLMRNGQAYYTTAIPRDDLDIGSFASKLLNGIKGSGAGRVNITQQQMVDALREYFRKLNSE